MKSGMMAGIAAWLGGCLSLSAVPVTALTYSPDGRALVSNGDRAIEVRAPKDAAVRRRIECPLAKVTSLAFSPDGHWLAAAGGEPGVRGEALLFSWPEGVLKHRFGKHEDIVVSVAIDPAGRRLVTASADHSAQVWSLVDDGPPVESFTLSGHSAAVLAVAFSPGNGSIVTASADRSLKVWSVADGKLQRSLGHHTEAVHALAFRPNSNGPATCASGADDRTVRVWQPEIGRMVRIVRNHHGPVLALAWSPDGRHLFSAGHEGLIRRIDGDSDVIQQEWRSGTDWIYALAVSPDGRMLAAGDWSGRVKLHPLRPAEAAPAEPKIISKIAGDRRDFQIVSKKFSPDGKEATFTLLEPTGIFAFQLDLSGAKLSKLTLIVQKQKSCEGLTFQPEGQKAIDLKQAEGVKISQQGEDLVIEFDTAAVEKLKPAGRLQFINQYR